MNSFEGLDDVIELIKDDDEEDKQKQREALADYDPNAVLDHLTVANTASDVGYWIFNNGDLFFDTTQHIIDLDTFEDNL